MEPHIPSSTIKVISDQTYKAVNIPSINIVGVKVHQIDIEQLHNFLESTIKENQHKRVMNVNVNAINLAYKFDWMRDFLNSADIVFCDGAGVIVGARILGYHLPERITYADWMWKLAEFAMQKNFSLYFLGGKPGVAEKAANQLVAANPNLNIAGTHHGYFDKNHNSSENRYLIDNINLSNPDILLVAFGMPLQERWLSENWHLMNANIALTGGAALDYVSGELKRAPHWLTNNSMEWLGRLIIEPKRLGKRYIIGNPLFFYRILLQKFGFLRV